jgi:hypothetical protein
MGTGEVNMSEIEKAIIEAFTAWGSNSSQVADAQLAIAPLTYLRNGDVILAETGKPLTDSASEKALRALKPHYFKSEVSEDQAAIAFSGKGNLLVRAELIRLHGRARVDEIAQEWGLKNAVDTKPGFKSRNSDGGKQHAKDRDNPWTADKWNVTRQGQIVRALGVEKAAAIARAANSRIGATKPAA